MSFVGIRPDRTCINVLFCFYSRGGRSKGDKHRVAIISTCGNEIMQCNARDRFCEITISSRQADSFTSSEACMRNVSI